MFPDLQKTVLRKKPVLKEGDVVVKIDETPIRTSAGLIEYIGRHRPGDKVNMLVNRKGKEVDYSSRA